MAVCSDCGKTIHWELVENGVCPSCRGPRLDPKPIPFDDRMSRIKLTTEHGSGMAIQEYLEIVTAECAFGMNMFKDLFAGVRDTVGGRSKAVQQTMRDARRMALYELKVEADLVGANAVIGVDLDYVELSKAGSMVMLVASGTAVVIKDP